MEDRPHWTPEARVLDRTNGSAAPPTERPNPLARRTEWCALGEGYPTYEVLIWVNPRIRKQTESATPGEERLLAKLTNVVLDHRCQDEHGQWVPWPHPDQDGPMPATSSAEFWDLIPDDALEAICRWIQEFEKKAMASVGRIFAGSTDSSSAEIRPSATGPNGSAGTTSGATSPSAGTAIPEP